MKKFAFATAAVLLLTTTAFAQSGGDNPGGRGVTSTGGPQGVTGEKTDGTMAAPVGTTGKAGTRATGGNAALSGNNGNSGSGDNSLGHIKGGDLGAGK